VGTSDVGDGAARSSMTDGAGGAPSEDLRTRRRRLVQDAVARIAVRLFLERGYDAVSVDQLATALETIESSRIILVSNEVGLGIVPDNALARTFRDLAGATHQRLAEICTDVYFIAAGLPLTLKGTSPAQN